MENNWREELAWAAGFFDGEGSIGTYINKGRTSLQFTLSVYQAERTTLERFQSAMLGIGSIYGPYVRKNRESNKPYFTYRANGHRSVQAVIALLWPFLSCPKKNQSKKAFQRIPLSPEQAYIVRAQRSMATKRQKLFLSYRLG